MTKPNLTPSHPLARRQFIAECALAVGTLAGVSLNAASLETPFRAEDVVTLGRSKIRASRQSLGLGDGKADGFKKLGQAGFNRLIRHALDKGVRYFDLLPGPAHEMLGVALKGVPRERYALVTNFRHPEEQNPARMVERFLKELQTDYLDAVLAGAILTKDWAWQYRHLANHVPEHSGDGRGYRDDQPRWEGMKLGEMSPRQDLSHTTVNPAHFLSLALCLSATTRAAELRPLPYPPSRILTGLNWTSEPHRYPGIRSDMHWQTWGADDALWCVDGDGWFPGAGDYSQQQRKHQTLNST